MPPEGGQRPGGRLGGVGGGRAVRPDGRPGRQVLPPGLRLEDGAEGDLARGEVEEEGLPVLPGQGAMARGFVPNRRSAPPRG